MRFHALDIIPHRKSKVTGKILSTARNNKAPAANHRSSHAYAH